MATREDLLDSHYSTIGREEPNMMIIGVDYHPGFQAIAFFVEETGECGEQELNHKDLVFLREGFQEHSKFVHNLTGQFTGGLFGKNLVADAVHFKEDAAGGDQFQCRSHFRSRAERISSAVNEKCGRGQLWEVSSSKFIMLSGRMKWVREQEQAIH